MPRIRTIKPSFFTSLTIAELDHACRLTFIGLWTHVDDEGRCVAEPRLIRAAIWPLDDDVTVDVVERHLQALAKHGLVRLYEAGGRRLLQVAGWMEHQRVSRPSRSGLPAPDSAESGQLPLPDEDSVSPHGVVSEWARRERKGKERKNTVAPDAATVEQFEKFWEVYPGRDGRKRGKGNALVEWQRLTLEQRRRAFRGAQVLAGSGDRPKDAERFLRRGKGGEFPFDDYQDGPVSSSPWGRLSVVEGGDG